MTRKKSTQIIRLLLLFGTIVSLYFVPWPILKARLTPLPNSVQEQVNKATDYGFEGIIVYIDKKGVGPTYFTAGFHNSEKKSPANPNSLFKIASIDKLYTAVAISKLVNAGHLSLDKTLDDYFPELAGRIENSDKITLRMLVMHRSGIPNFTDTPDYWNDPAKNEQEALDKILDMPAKFDPDDKYEYSNTNYLLISKLIERVTGGSKFNYIKGNILDPIGLKNTFASIHDVDINNVMSGYYVGVKEDIKTADYGSMLATAEDVGIFLRALNEGSLFEGEEQKIYSSIYVYDHTGLIPGYQSIAKYHKDIDAVVIQFTNTTDFNGYNWSLSEIMYNRIVKMISNKT
ncbi:serine hydrolase domain-containing protein [Namhaeicola litoreus]|uniref:Serine hydrolase domain-containing protein n=1 Tax=Namhaeicola litoreus TaxID=1052145 RepID=A0ABW3Y016_9FLAO